MKILHVIPNLLKGGAQRLVIDICNELSKKESVDCRILVLSYSNNEFQFCSSSLDITYCSVSFKLSIFKKNKINIGSYESFIDEFKPDVIHSHLYFSELVCHENPRLNIKYISHLHDNNMIFKKTTFKSFLRLEKKYVFFEKYRLIYRYLRVSKTFISISSSTTNFFMRNVPKLSNHLVELHNAINLNRFSPGLRAPSKEVIKLISVGNLFKQKNHIFLLDVVRYIKTKKYAVSLNIVGDGEEKNKILNRAKELGIENQLILSGQTNFVEEELKKADFYVHSAKHESFGLVIIEAMASKIPVITLNGNGNQDLVMNGVNGYIVEKQNPYYFGDIIIDLFLNRNKRNKIICEAYKFSMKFDIKVYVKKLLNIYSK